MVIKSIPCVHFSAFPLDFLTFVRVEPESTKEVRKRSNKNRQKPDNCNSGKWTEMRMRPSSSSASHSTQAEYKTAGRAGAESPCEACRYTNVIGHVPPSERTACAVSESVIFWGAAQMLGWMVAVSGGVVVKTTEPCVGAKWRRNPRLCLAADVRFRASMFPPFPLIFSFFRMGA